ncbi:MAG: co-chaperone GroES [Bdellovibrionales bacterium]|nr:co-chaperone GroES [Bdellovibrionales bacterium]
MEGISNIRPLFDNVVIRKDQIEETSKTGIITGSSNQPALIGLVISTGKDVEEEIKPGDRIMYAPFSDTGKEFGDYVVIAQHDILGVIEEEKQ